MAHSLIHTTSWEMGWGWGKEREMMWNRFLDFCLEMLLNILSHSQDHVTDLHFCLDYVVVLFQLLKYNFWLKQTKKKSHEGEERWQWRRRGRGMSLAAILTGPWDLFGEIIWANHLCLLKVKEFWKPMWIYTDCMFFKCHVLSVVI